MSVQYASIQHGSSYLFTDYGYALALQKFGKDAIDALPKFGPRSKHNGKPKGIVSWRRVTEGGWVRLEQRVERRVGQIISAELREMAPYGKGLETGKLVASWSADLEAAGRRADAQEQQELRVRATTLRDYLRAGHGLMMWINYKLEQNARLAAAGF